MDLREFRPLLCGWGRRSAAALQYLIPPIPYFSNWKNHDDFEKAFDDLFRDLKAEETKIPAH